MNNNDHNVVGVNGENVVFKYLQANGHEVLGRNVRYKCGELDLVSMKKGILHFVEVKTAHVIRETHVTSVLPEENLTFGKVMRLKRAIQMYFIENKIKIEEVDWQFDLYTVVIHETPKKVVIKKYENLII